MKKHLLLFLSSIMVIGALFGTQINVLSEVFKSTTCPYCPSAQAGLQDLYNNQPNVIPLTWYTGSSIVSPNGSTRLSWYGSDGVPYAVFGGTTFVSGGYASGSMYAPYLQKYNSIISRQAPMELDVSMNFNDANQLVLTANVLMTGNITDTNNKIIFVLTDHNPNSTLYVVSAYNEQAFPLNQNGQTGVYTATFNYNGSVSIQNLKAVAFVQTWSTTKTVFQAAQSGFSGMLSTFDADILSGPADLTVNFTDNSLPQGGITEWNWDFDNDGTIDSNEQNPSHTYSEPGTYSVSLTVSDGTDSETKTITNMITVTGTDNVSGSVQGVWNPVNGIYTLTGDVEVAPNKTLEILAGTVIKLAEGKAFVVRGDVQALGTEADSITFTSDTYWNGMSIENSDTPSFFRNCVFTKALFGAMKVSGTTVEIDDSRFVNNNGTTFAGAIDFIESTGSIINNCYFANNSASNSSGAVNIMGSSVDLKKNVFVNNTGKNAGALTLKTNSEVYAINNTFANNNNVNNPGGQILLVSSNMNILNSIIWGSNPFFQQNSQLNIQYSCVADYNIGTGNINIDPLFVNPSTTVGFAGVTEVSDWYLQSSSPCIDAGHPNSSFNDKEDPANLGHALSPALGLLRNDMGAFGGNTLSGWVANTDNPIVTSSIAKLSTYPNPFNPTVKISLDLPKSTNEKITIELYNIRGQKVKTLFKNNSSQEKISAVWDGKDNNGNSMPTGVYFVKANIGQNQISKKILMIK